MLDHNTERQFVRASARVGALSPDILGRALPLYLDGVIDTDFEGYTQEQIAALSYMLEDLLLGVKHGLLP